ncbi:MAG: hypothetical protein NTZ49_01135 [Candidatus Parcubacteria bacterium]|nr:hypothetical protein [Candidatus Parcubacteria bacterium]
MKKAMIAVFCLMFALFANACMYAGDEGDNNNNITINDGDTVVYETGALYHFTAYAAYGQDAWLQIQNLETDEWNSELITVTTETMYRFLEPGEYRIWISGVNGAFDWYGHISVQENVVTDVYAEFHEYTMVNIWMASNASTPSGMSPIGNYTQVLKFDLAHDYPEAISINDLGFTLWASPTVVIESATLWVVRENGWEEVATSVNLGDNFFYLDLGRFVPLYPGVTQFMLTAEITGAYNGDVLQAEMTMAGYTPDIFTRGNFQSFAIGNILTF